VLENRARADFARIGWTKKRQQLRARAQKRERKRARDVRAIKRAFFRPRRKRGTSFITGARDHHRQDGLLCNVIARFAVETANRPAVLPRTERPSKKKPMENRSCGRLGSFGSAFRDRESVVAKYTTTR